MRSSFLVSAPRLRLAALLLGLFGVAAVAGLWAPGLLLNTKQGDPLGTPITHTRSMPEGGDSRHRTSRAIALSPLSFEPNIGQMNPQTKFVAHSGEYVLFLTSHGIVLRLESQESGVRSQRKKWQVAGSKWQRRTGLLSSLFINQNPEVRSQGLSVALDTRHPKPDTVRLTLARANPHPKIVGLNRLGGISNYFIGTDPKKWRTNVPNYAKVLAKDVYPGIDQVFHSKDGQLEYDFVVHPGADPGAIKIALESGNSKIEHAANGDIIIPTGTGEVRLGKPEIYQPTTGTGRRTRNVLLPQLPVPDSEIVQGNYVLSADNELSFSLGKYDAGRELVVDPTLSYVSTFGGSAGTEGSGIAVDAEGNAYVAGSTNSTDFPTTGGAFQTSSGGSTDAVVRKIAPSGGVVYSTYLGGSGIDEAFGIAVDASGDAYVTGVTASSDFPVVGSFRTALAGADDAFVTELNSTGSALIYSFYLGGASGPVQCCDQLGLGIAVDSAGAAYVTGATPASDFPTLNAFQPTFGGGQCGTTNGKPQACPDAFVTKVAAGGGALVYSTFLGGSADDDGYGITADPNGNAYVAGLTDSFDFPVHNAFQPVCATRVNASGVTYCGSAFVTELDASGSALVFSTYLGGPANEGADEGYGIALDGAGDVYVTGVTNSTAFPTANAFQPSNNAAGVKGYNSFVTEFAPGGGSLVYSTYLGGSTFDPASGIAVDSYGEAFVVGTAMSSDFPTVNAIQGSLGCTTNGSGTCENVFVTAFGGGGSRLDYSTYLGNGEQMGIAIATDAGGDAWITGASGTATFAASISRQQALSHRPGVDSFKRAIPAQAGSGATQALAGSIALDMARVSPTPTSLAFDPQLVGGSIGPQAVMISNPGTAALQITDISASSSFSVASGGTCSTSTPVAPNGNCTVNVAFAPTMGGNMTGSLTLADNGIGSPHTVPLSGTGQDFALSSGQTSATVAPGQTANYSLSLSPQGGLAATVSLSCSGAPSGATCTVPDSVSLDGTNPAMATAVVRTTAASFEAPRRRFGPPPNPTVVLFLSVVFAVFVGLSLVSAKKRSLWKSALKWAFLTSAVFIALFWAGCGGGNNTIHNPGTPAGTYSLTVTARTTSGATTDTHTLTLTLNVT